MSKTDAEPADQAPPCADLPLTRRAEAVLLTTERPLSDQRLADLLGIGGKGAAARVRETIDELNAEYEQSGRSFRAEHVAGGWQLMTTPEYGPLLERQHHQKQEFRLSQAALETLAIIAYRQPIMRAEIEAIRGVACGEVVRGLMERRLVRVAGRAEQLGRPLLYGTTPQFLKVFGIGATDELPPVDIDVPAAPETPPAPEPEPTASGDEEKKEEASE
ncbi:MAG: SMC-Scp complex subunit ScpB [Planctomycetota bacterium]|jgi:segregation and condensation protein B